MYVALDLLGIKFKCPKEGIIYEVMGFCDFYNNVRIHWVMNGIKYKGDQDSESLLSDLNKGVWVVVEEEFNIFN